VRAQLGILVAGLVLVVLGTRPARAAETKKRPFILDRGSVELLIAQGGWRSGLSPDELNPGFSVLGGGGEVVLGLDVVPGIGIIVSGKVLAGPRLDGVYVEGLGGLGAQLRLSDWVRVRLGIAAGQARLDRDGLATDRAVLLGGFLAASVDLFRLAHDRAAVEIALRLDVDGHLDAGRTFPRESLSLALALGVRF